MPLGYTSPGAAFTHGLERVMLQRAAQAREDRELELREEEMKINAQVRREAQAETMRQHESGRAAKIYETAGSGRVISPQTADLLDKYGYAVDRPEPLTFQGPIEDGSAPPTLTQPPLRIGPSPSFEAARVKAGESATQMELNRDLKEQQLRQMAGQQEITNELRRQGINIQAGMLGIAGEREARQRETAESKADALREANVSRASANISAADEALTDIQGLLDDKGNLNVATKNLYGDVFSRNIGRAKAAYGNTDEADAQARISRLAAERIVETIKSMKEQSRTGATGFGQLNQQELQVLQDASSVLKRPNITHAMLAQEVARVQKIYLAMRSRAEGDIGKSRSGGGAGGADAGDVVEYVRDPTGRLVPRGR